MATIRRAAVPALLALLIFVFSGAAGALDLNDIIRLKLAGVSETTIMDVVHQEGTAFVLSVDDIIDLKDAGASDWLIEQLLETEDEAGDRGYSYDVDPEWEDVYGADDYDAYDDFLDPYGYTTVFSYQYYDPFAYYWYPMPYSYIYYSPFWWSCSGFYFAGHWTWDWWDPWGPSYYYWDHHHGWDHHFGPSHTRERDGRSWHDIDRQALRERADREAQIGRAHV